MIYKLHVTKYFFMAEISYKSIDDLSNVQITQGIGNFVKHHRLLQNKSQEQLAREVGIARSTLSLFERGENTSLVVFVQILRALNLLDKLAVFELDESVVTKTLPNNAKEKPQGSKPKGESGSTNESDWAFY
jgi:transcriptional regulator with XRE-family HTH domain